MQTRMMKPILITYATREGQTRRIAEHISDLLRRRHIMCAQYDLAELQRVRLHFEDYAATILLASVHNRTHEPEAVNFAKRWSAQLNASACLVLSVSSAQILAESPRAPAWLVRLTAAGARTLLERFLSETELRTKLAYPVAGALAFTKYAAHQRWAFALFAHLGRVHIDMARDCEYTDLHAVDRHVDVLLAAIKQQAEASLQR